METSFYRSPSFAKLATGERALLGPLPPIFNTEEINEVDVSLLDFRGASVVWGIPSICHSDLKYVLSSLSFLVLGRLVDPSISEFGIIELSTIHPRFVGYTAQGRFPCPSLGEDCMKAGWQRSRPRAA